MAVSIQARGARHQLRVTHPLLPKPFFFTFDTDTEASAYGAQLSALLARGIVPVELSAPAARGADDPQLVEVVRAYIKAAPLTDSDDALLASMLDEISGASAVRMSGMTFAWADAYVGRLKARKLAPSTIRKHVGVLARVIDWQTRRTTAPSAHPLANPLRLLPVGYSAYSRAEVEQLQLASADVPRDQQRDRRLGADEQARIEAALAGHKRDDRERALQPDVDLAMLFALILDTGLRLREAYRLRVDQVDLVRGVIAVDGTKGHRGAAKPRHVPIKPALGVHLQRHLRGRVGRIFPWWDGTPEGLRPATSRLSERFRVLFDYAEVPDMTEHDLRHEATCRWVELRSPRGGWTFSDLEICRIMGWTDPAMMLRYASLRGEDLAARLR